MHCRTFPASTAAALAAPAIARGEASQVLKFVPQADLAVLDPIWTTTYQTRDHGLLVFDTLFGLDSRYKPQPQMAEGAVSEDGGKAWRITLRPDLMFHALGQYFIPTAYQANLTGMLQGSPVFWNIRRS
jgi:peptide/nickel transport system substrate-binding protein